MDEEPREPFDPSASHIAEAQGRLAAARKAGHVGPIALAQFDLAATLAAAGATESAIREFRDLIAYLDMAQEDEESQLRRMLRMTSPAAPPAQQDDIDPVVIQAISRIHLAECLLVAGDRAAAARELDLAAPATRGLGRGQLRRRLAQVRKRMAAAAEPLPADTTPPSSPRSRHGPHGDRSPGPGKTEQLAAADELLGNGHFEEAARISLEVIGQCAEKDAALRGQARQILGLALEAMEQPTDAAAVLTDCFHDYVSADENEAAAQVALHLGWRLAQLNRQEEAVQALERALACCQGSGLAELRAQLLTDLGSLLDQQEDRSEARRTFEGAVAVAEETTNRELVANARHGLAVVLASTSTTDHEDEVEALSLLDHCRDDYDALDLPDRAAGCEHEAAALLGRLGSFAAAQTRYEKALERYQALPAEQRDTGAWPDEVQDVRTNLTGLATGTLQGPGLFTSGGHQMHHPQ